ncbi:MAG TPA: TonB-dependent receptor [Bacteroidales bacterium]|nr:TonB-dependent receptor [Bacteroidales bacterium]
MKNRMIICGIFSILLLSSTALSQKPVQNIRGLVLDAETMEPLSGATIVILEENKGTISDLSGNFILENIEVGRYTIQVSFVGYEAVIIPELLLTSGSELILEIKLKPSLSELKEVVVKPDIRKDRPINSMATVSARTFSVEEASRYAGAIDDPGRMASNFAGVTSVAPHINAIVIRGNAPKGLAWRLEGTDIPVPSHFSGSNVVGGGGLTVFSSQLLANSDFYTGAFPAEFGNASAGVFDMKLRNGNRFEREYAIQVGIQGIEAAAEGPFKKGGVASYLLNYRYSTMALIFPLLPEVNFTDELPVYQDLSYKINLPTKNAGTFSFWGIGGLSNSKMRGSDIPSDWIYPENKEQMDFQYNMGASGLSYSGSLKENTYIHSSISMNGSKHVYRESSRLDPLNPEELFPLHDIRMINTTTAFTNKLTRVFNSRFSMKLGVESELHWYELSGKTRNYESGEFIELMDSRDHSWLLEGYAQGKFKVNRDLFLTGGINASWLEINNEYNVEPRFSASWKLDRNHQVSLGYGNHSQVEPLFVYFVKAVKMNGEVFYPNKKLKRMKAHHFVFAHDWSISENLRLKIEPYYQKLYDVPVEDNSLYSMVNFMSDWTFNRELVNKGTGRNIGIDITLERFLNNGFYFMTTSSIYDSKYTSGDGKEYQTRYNGGYVINVLGGKEWEINDKNLLGINVRFTFMGPYWYNPVDYLATQLAGTIIYDEERPFTDRYAPLENSSDLAINYIINGSKGSSIITLQLKNILGKQYMGKKYNLKYDKIENDFFSSPVPFISYKYEF